MLRLCSAIFARHYAAVGDIAVITELSLNGGWLAN